MSTYQLPSNTGAITQPNNGDVSGELWGAFNIDLYSSRGKMRVSKRLSPTLSEAKMSNDDVQAFCRFGSKTYGFADSSRVLSIESYRNSRLTGSWSATTYDSFDIGNETDAVVFGGAMLVSTGTNIARTTDGSSYDTDWWTTVSVGGDTGVALDNGVPHTMDVSRIGAETLFVTNGNKVHYANEVAGHSTVTLASQLTACCLATDYKATWVGTYSNEGDAYVYEIYIGETDTASTPIARNSYKIEGSAVLSMEVVDGVVFIVTDRGKIQYFNGIAFVDATSFPFAWDNVSIDGMSVGDIDDENNLRAVHPKGMRRDGKSLLININTNNELIDDLAANPLDNDDEFENIVVNERSPSGVWEYNTETGQLTHLAALNADTDTQGFHRQQRSGAILVTNNQYTRFLTTGRVLSTRTDILAQDPSTSPFGYVITREINSQTIQDAWEKLAIKHNDLIDGESIEIKYRTDKVRGYPKYSEANWTGASTFVVTNDASMVSVGDEVEVIDGYGAGKIAHVTEITSSTTTYTVTLDTAIGANSETSNVRFQNWKRATAEDLTDTQTVGLDKVSNWVQFKIVLNGFIEIRQMFNKGSDKTNL